MKVSLILTTYNCKENLQKTLKSLETQDYSDLEIIIKDGKSTDGTLALIQDFAGKHDNVKWVSEKDSGIYDAMNQGYQMSTGDIIAYFNDIFVGKDAVSKFVRAIENGGNDCMGAHADLVYVEGDKVIRYWRMGQGKIKQGWMPGHPTLYLKREVYEKYGLYDTSFVSSSDYEFMVRILKDDQLKIAYIPETLIAMFYGGTSSGGIKGYWRNVKEAYYSLKKNNVKYAWLVILKRVWKVSLQFITSQKTVINGKSE